MCIKLIVFELSRCKKLFFLLSPKTIVKTSTKTSVSAGRRLSAAFKHSAYEARVPDRQGGQPQKTKKTVKQALEKRQIKLYICIIKTKCSLETYHAPSGSRACIGGRILNGPTARIGTSPA